MTEGVVLYFSPCGRMASIWCVLSEVPLCVAHQSDFPGLWAALQIGTRVRLKFAAAGEAVRVVEMRLFGDEMAGLDGSG